MRLSCPLVTVEARVILAEDLAVSVVDFLLGNDLKVGEFGYMPHPKKLSRRWRLLKVLPLFCYSP